LPFCHKASEEELVEEGNQREGALRHRQRLGESIVGDRRETSPYDITFMDNTEWRVLCKETLEPAELRKFKDVIHNNYFFEMFVEDLPMWVSELSADDFDCHLTSYLTLLCA
jgi:transmembrane 9 superfamily member 3